ncbi:hypothetical protein V1264_000910 [Littorina saxatilis]
MLTDAKWPDARKARIVLNEEPECVKVFGEFLQYMYTGSIHLNNSSMLPVLTLADKYNIHDLGNVCRQYMLSHCHASLENLKVISWLQYAILCNDHDLESTLRCYVELNFNHVMQSEDFLTMRVDTLEEVLQSEHLVIHSEYSLYVGLKHWLLHNTGSSSKVKQSKAQTATEKKTTLRIMSYIRLPLVKQAQLLLLQSDPFVQRHADFFFPKLQAAWTVHTCQHGRGTWCLGDAGDSKSHSCKGSRHLSKQISVDCKNVTDQSSVYCENFTNQTSNIGEQVKSQCLKGSRSFTRANFLGSRSVLRRNSDSSIVFSPPDSKIDFLEKLSLVRCSKNCLSGFSRFLDAPATSENNIGGNSQHGFGCFVDSSAASLIPGSSRGDTKYYTPRNYTCDDWSTCLTIEEVAAFPRYASHTYFFSTPASVLLSSSSFAVRCQSSCAKLEETDDSAMLEWQAELYPKGVRFPPAKMIGIPSNYDIDENCRDVVRLSVSSKTHHAQPCRVDVSVLAVASGMEDGLEYMEALAHKSCIFDADHTMHNIDDIVSFAELNRIRSKYLTESVAAPESGRTCFKVVVIIKPSH